jgi:hypothetical protein
VGKKSPQKVEVVAARGGRPDSFEDDDLGEAPTEKRSIVGEGEPAPPVYVTTKLRKVEIDALLARERARKQQEGRMASGLRPAVTEETIERHERRSRETLPAPASDDDTQPVPLAELGGSRDADD